MGWLLLGVKDDSSVCNARMTKEEISLGRGKMLKPAGINWGRQEWKRSVRTQSEG
jgi:hypothetical protein